MSLFRNPKPRMSPAWWVAIALGVFSPLALATLPIQHWVQPSGARIYFVESSAIPIVDVQIDFDAGTRRDPAGKPTLANLTADMMETGIVARRILVDLHEADHDGGKLGTGFPQARGHAITTHDRIADGIAPNPHANERRALQVHDLRGAFAGGDERLGVVRPVDIEHQTRPHAAG